jgi:hypothetical protein
MSKIRLTEIQKQLIHQLHNKGVSEQKIADQIGCSRSTVWRNLLPKERRLAYYKKGNNTRWLQEQKIGRACGDCDIMCTEENYPIFDWDHRPGEEKLFVISQTPRGRTQLLSEIAKCDLVCSNCHRMRTHRRRLNAQSEALPTQ